MNLGTYAVGAILLVACVLPLLAAAVKVRRVVLPSWRGLPASLAEITITLLLLLAVLHVLGAVGLFRRGAVTAGCVVTGSLIAVAAGRFRPPRRWNGPRDEPRLAAETPPRTAARWTIVAMVAMVGVLAAQWARPTLHAVRVGITDFDSNWYHLPHAARFVQDGWITRLHFTGPEFPTAFHPGDSELLHAFGMLLFKSDVLSPLLNGLWLMLALAASWCIGRPWGIGPLAVAATALVLATPDMAALQAGTAMNDIATVCAALLIAAFLLQPGRDRWATTLAGLAAGLAIGVKLTMLAPVAALTIGVVVIARRGERVNTAVRWIAALCVTGSYWYVRNFVRAGSPVPSLPLPGFPSPNFALVDQVGFSVAHYIADGTGWREFFHPGLHNGLGAAWWLMLALGVSGIVTLLVAGSAEQRVLAAVAGSAIVAFLVMPTSAGGPDGIPFLFQGNLRYAYPGLGLGLLLLLTMPRLNRNSHAAAFFVVATAFVVTVLGANSPLRLGGGDSAPHAARWAQGLHTKIGLVNEPQPYWYYGPDLENTVQYVGVVSAHGGFHDIESCPAWRAALAAGGYRYLVVGTPLVADPSSPGTRGLAWTVSDPAATLVVQESGHEVFALDGSSDAASCPPP